MIGWPLGGSCNTCAKLCGGEAVRSTSMNPSLCCRLVRSPNDAFGHTARSSFTKTIRMNRSSSMYALLILVLVTTGLYHAIPHSSNIEAVQRIAGFQLALSFCAIACFFANFVASIRFLQRHRPSSDALAVAAAEVGLLLCGVLLVTEAVSSYRLMGVWWTWSTSGTAALLFGFIYGSYLILRRYANAGQTSTLAAVLGIFAFADIPLTYISVAMRNAAGRVTGLERLQLMHIVGLWRPRLCWVSSQSRRSVYGSAKKDFGRRLTIDRRSRRARGETPSTGEQSSVMVKISAFERG
jgi:ABC-type transport system involved in cytochrome c biogenesis permease subunit